MTESEFKRLCPAVLSGELAGAELDRWQSHRRKNTDADDYFREYAALEQRVRSARSVAVESSESVPRKPLEPQFIALAVLVAVICLCLGGVVAMGLVGLPNRDGNEIAQNDTNAPALSTGDRIIPNTTHDNTPDDTPPANTPDANDPAPIDPIPDGPTDPTPPADSQPDRTPPRGWIWSMQENATLERAGNDGKFQDAPWDYVPMTGDELRAIGGQVVLSMDGALVRLFAGSRMTVERIEGGLIELELLAGTMSVLRPFSKNRWGFRVGVAGARGELLAGAYLFSAGRAPTVQVIDGKFMATNTAIAGEEYLLVDSSVRTLSPDERALAEQEILGDHRVLVDQDFESNRGKFVLGNRVESGAHDSTYALSITPTQREVGVQTGDVLCNVDPVTRLRFRVNTGATQILIRLRLQTDGGSIDAQMLIPVGSWNGWALVDVALGDFVRRDKGSVLALTSSATIRGLTVSNLGTPGLSIVDEPLVIDDILIYQPQ